MFVKSFTHLEGQWIRIDPGVELNEYPDVGYNVAEMVVSFSKEYDEHDLLVSKFFDLKTKKIIELDHTEIYKKIGVNPEKDHPESYKIKQAVLGRKNDKVLFRIVKRQNIKHKTKGWDDTIGYYDAYLLQVELDFSNGSYTIVYESRNYFEKGQEIFPINFKTYDPYAFEIKQGLVFHHHT